MSPQKPIRMVSRQEEKELLDWGHEVLLSDFPNPERLGCPGSETLRALAVGSGSLSLSERSRWLDHMTCCSPCFSEFSTFVDQARYRKRLAVIGFCALFLLAIGLVTWFTIGKWRSKSGESMTHKVPSTERREPEKKPQQQKAPEIGPQEPRREVANQQPQPKIYRDMILDVRDQSVARGESPKLPESKYPRIPRGLLNLSIYLPLGSEAGKYHLTIFKKPGKLLLRTTAIGRIWHGITIIRIKLDTTQMLPGAYILESREANWTSGYQYTFLVGE